MSVIFQRLATQGTDIEHRLLIFLEDLRGGISLDAARGVKQFEYDAWLEASEAQIQKHCPPGSGLLKEWNEIRNDFLNDKYYDRCEIDGKISKLIYYFRRHLKIILRLSFEHPHEAEVKNVNSYNIHIENNSGLVAVMSKLDNVSQTLANGSLDKRRKDELLQLMAELKSVLGAVPPDSSGDAELVVEQAEKIGAEMSRPSPRPNALRITAQGLVEAAKALGAVVPEAIKVARKIAEFVTSPVV